MKTSFGLTAALAAFLSVVLAACGEDQASVSANQRKGAETGESATESALIAEAMQNDRVAALRQNGPAVSAVTAEAIAMFAIGHFEQAFDVLAAADIPEAERHYWRARLGLQASYFAGRGSHDDLINQLAEAAEAGNVHAAFDLGRLLLNSTDDATPVTLADLVALTGRPPLSEKPEIGALRAWLLAQEGPTASMSSGASGSPAALVEAALVELAANLNSSDAAARLSEFSIPADPSGVAAYVLGLAAQTAGEQENATEYMRAAANAGLSVAGAWLAFDAANRLRLVPADERDAGYVVALEQARTDAALGAQSGIAAAQLAYSNILAELARLTDAEPLGLRDSLAASEQAGFGQASFDLAVARFHGIDGPIDASRAWAGFQALAAANHPDAAYLVATRDLIEGNRLDSAVPLYRLSAEQLRPAAAFNLLSLIDAGCIEPTSLSEIEGLRGILELTDFNPADADTQPVEVDGKVVILMTEINPQFSPLSYYSLDTARLQMSNLRLAAPYDAMPLSAEAVVLQPAGGEELARTVSFAFDEVITLDGEMLVREALSGDIAWRSGLDYCSEGRQTSTSNGRMTTACATVPAGTLSGGLYYAYHRGRDGVRSQPAFIAVFERSAAELADRYPDYLRHANRSLDSAADPVSRLIARDIFLGTDLISFAEQPSWSIVNPFERFEPVLAWSSAVGGTLLEDWIDNAAAVEVVDNRDGVTLAFARPGQIVREFPETEAELGQTYRLEIDLAAAADTSPEVRVYLSRSCSDRPRDNSNHIFTLTDERRTYVVEHTYREAYPCQMIVLEPVNAAPEHPQAFTVYEYSIQHVGDGLPD